MNNADVTMVTDGSAAPNPGPGGWGCILLQGERRADLSGAHANTTNNRMELTAVIEGFRALLLPGCNVEVISDSAYVVRQLWEGRIKRWAASNWVRWDGSEVKNADLWAEALSVMEGHRVTWTLVKGHSGHALNEQADRLALNARKHKGTAQ